MSEEVMKSTWIPTELKKGRLANYDEQEYLKMRYRSVINLAKIHAINTLRWEKFKDVVYFSFPFIE